MIHFSVASQRCPYEIKLADGSSRVSELCYTICGTPEFLAPEYVLSKGYGKSADWWALGCVVFEMLFGRNPFTAGDLKEMFTRTCRVGMGVEPLPIPTSFQSSHPHSANLMSRLLTRQENRLGRLGVHEVQAHEYWGALDWSELLTKTLAAPYKPAGSFAGRFGAAQGSSQFHNGPTTPVFFGRSSWCKGW